MNRVICVQESDNHNNEESQCRDAEKSLGLIKTQKRFSFFFMFNCVLSSIKNCFHHCFFYLHVCNNSIRILANRRRQMIMFSLPRDSPYTLFTILIIKNLSDIVVVFQLNILIILHCHAQRIMSLILRLYGSLSFRFLFMPLFFLFISDFISVKSFSKRKRAFRHRMHKFACVSSFMSRSKVDITVCRIRDISCF